MKKYYIIFIILIIIMSVIFYILRRNKEVISEEDILNSNDIYINYRVTNMRDSKKYIFSINENESKYELLRYNDEVLVSTNIDKEDIKNLKDALIIGHVNKWDGFSKSNKYVMDGEMFDFTAKINGIKIYATGSNSFPKGYRDFYNKINNIVKKYDIINE